MLKKLLVISVVFASLGLAQRGGGSKGGDAGGIPGPMPSGISNKLDAMAMTLNLNKDQKKTLKTILEDGAKEAAPLRDQISKSRIAVGDAVAAKKSDDEIKQAARASGEISSQLTQLEMKTFAKIFASLDETEKTNRQGITHVLGIMTGIYHNKNWNED